MYSESILESISNEDMKVTSETQRLYIFLFSKLESFIPVKNPKSFL